MNLVWQLAVHGSVGFVIGAGTNDLAIRWLFATFFRRKKAVIAASIQNVVSKELMSSDKIVAKLSEPGVRATFEKNVRRELDHICDGAGTFLGGIVGGFRPLLPEIARAELEALGKIGKMFGGEVRDIMARVCASQLSVYLSRNLPEIIENTHVWNIIHDSIISLDEAHLELLTRQVANRELYGITIWGGVIGALVSTVMCLVMYVIG